MSARARQLIGSEVISAEATTPVQLKYYVDPKWLESLVDLGVLLNVASYDDLDNKFL